MVAQPLPPVQKPSPGWNGEPAIWDDRVKGDPGPNELRVVVPGNVYRGKTYSDLISDWFNWLLSADPDKHNSGPVAFLRAVEIPSADVNTSSTRDLTVSNAYADDAYFPRRYPNNPNIMVGGDRLQIYEDQAVFVPIIVAYAEAMKPYVDWGLMQENIGLIIDNGDNPPAGNQLTIDEKPVIPNKEMTQFRISTPIFIAVVPETDYGRSAKDFLEVSFPPGHYHIMAEGYFVLIRFGPGTYQLHSVASSGRETPGHYFAELLYEIEVMKRSPHRPRPARNVALIGSKLQDKIRKGELDPARAMEIGRKAGVKVTKPT